MYKARQILSAIRKQLNSGRTRILVFTGARQVGKTTLVRELLKDYTYLSIEDPVMRVSYKSLSATQWKTLFPKAILDEVQKEPQLIESIKSAYDQFPDVYYVLLGSSQLLLMEKVRESLAGRCVIHDLFPLVLPEIRTRDFSDQISASLWQRLLSGEQTEFLPSFLLDPEFALKSGALRQYLSFGGYPAIVGEDMTEEERFLWLSNYVRTYLERDIRDLTSFRELDPFVKLQKAVALQTGGLFNASALATRVGVSSKTVQRYLNYLNISYQTLTLPSWERNESRSLVKSSKVHFMDPGVLGAVLGKRGGMSGEEFESAIVAELYKQARNISSQAKFYHLRTHDGLEVDLLVETPTGYYAFEIKQADHVQRTDARHLMKLSGIIDKPLLHGFVLSQDNVLQHFSDNITALHAGYFLG